MTAKDTAPTPEIDQLTEEATRPEADTARRVDLALQIHGQAMSPAIFNRRERRLVQEALIVELEQGFEQRRQAISMAMESRLHSIREACNHVLVIGKTHLRQQRIEFYGNALRQLEKRMNTLAEDFLEEADQRFTRLERYQNETIKAREKKRIDKSVDQFLSTLDAMMEEFNNIVSEHIDHNPQGNAHLT